MRRFYKEVSAKPSAEGNGFTVLLDGKPVRTPGKLPLNAPTQKLADAIAAEWDAQKTDIVHDTMPLTQMLTTALDRADARAEITENVLAYVNSDLLCYIAHEPQSLHDELVKTWQPSLTWFEKTFGTALKTTPDLIRLDQPEDAHKAVRADIEKMNLHQFTVMQTATAVTGSIVLGLALTHNAISAADALNCALCEEFHYERTHDLERHGHDPIEEKRRHSMKRDLEACVLYRELV